MTKNKYQVFHFGKWVDAELYQENGTWWWKMGMDIKYDTVPHRLKSNDNTKPSYATWENINLLP